MKRTVLFATVAVAAVLDRFLKMVVQKPYFDDAHVGWRYFGIERHHNFGVAFNVPIPLAVVVPLTVGVVVALVLWARRATRLDAVGHAAVAAICVGALSNLVDRVAYGYTIDFLRIFNGIINFADVLVLAGMCVLVWRKAP